jgi:pyruvate/2-oxoacid:ferredoxin oxidoreductase alpha subunit
LKIGIKFCGGCNPAFDRIAAAEKIKNKLKDKAEFVSFTDPEAEMILVFMGCSSACAEINGMNMEKVKIINSESDADSLTF